MIEPSKNDPAIIGDCVLHLDVADEVVQDALKKSKMTFSQLSVRSFLCTPFLAYATTLCALLVAQGWSTASAGLLFPVGYVMLAFLGLEMVTGNFSVLPIGFLSSKLKLMDVGKNWSIVFLGNLVGGAFFAVLLWFSLTKGGMVSPPPVLEVLARLAEKKISYNHYGASGWLSAIGMGILCNWLVSLAPIIAKFSKTVAGKIMLMWLPIATFFAIGFEHSVVNLFVFPIGILSGADVSIQDWWLWNQIPVTLGNIFGAVIFNSMLLWGTHRRKSE